MSKDYVGRAGHYPSRGNEHHSQSHKRQESRLGKKNCKSFGCCILRLEGAAGAGGMRLEVSQQGSEGAVCAM
jgi:hypothetical protein